jgi:flagellar protein FlgJ
MAISAPVYMDFQSLKAMHQGAREKNPDTIKQVAKQFESMFVQMMLKSMRDAVPEDSMFGSQQERMYQDMYDKQISMNISSGQGIGLAAVIERQLNPPQDVISGESKTLDDYFKHPVTRHRPVAQTAAIDHPYEGATITANDSGKWQQPEDFVRDVWPHAIEAANTLGVDPEVLIAQSALETGWGRYMRSLDNGQNSYSLFGIKADSRWQGKTVSVSTLEFEQGAMHRQQANFRAYDSIGEAFRDYVDFIQSHSRYQQALEHGYSPEAYVKGLQQAGYATDPEYAAKINRVRNSDLLQVQVSTLKNGPKVPLT